MQHLLLPQNACGKSFEGVYVYFSIFTDVESKANVILNITRKNLKIFTLTYITRMLEPET